MQKRFPLPPFAPSPEKPCHCRSGRTFGSCCGLRAADREPPVGVLKFPGFIDPATCGKWVKRLEEKPRTSSTVGNFSKPGAATVTSQLDPVRVCSDVKPGVMRKVINDRVAEAFRIAAAKTGRTVAWFETPRILRYEPGGYYLAHADSCLFDQPSNTWFKVHDRDISLLIYLNEDFTGGGLTFTRFNYHLRPRTGDMLAFPSDNRFEHRAEVVLTGLRYVLVSWAALNGIQRVHEQPPQKAIHLS